MPFGSVAILSVFVLGSVTVKDAGDEKFSLVIIFKDIVIMNELENLGKTYEYFLLHFHVNCANTVEKCFSRGSTIAQLT